MCTAAGHAVVIRQIVLSSLLVGCNSMPIKRQVQQIFGDTRQQLQTLRKESEPRVDEIRQQTDQRLQQVLTPEQWQDFQQMRDEMRARRGRGGAR